MNIPSLNFVCPNPTSFARTLSSVGVISAVLAGCSFAPAPIAGDCSFMTDPTQILDEIIAESSTGFDKVYFGTSGDDRILVRLKGAPSISWQLNTLGGNDTICVEEQVSSLSPGDVSVVAGSGDDTIFARNQSGTYYGGVGNDTFYTHTIIATFQRAHYYGEAGEDTFISRAWSRGGFGFADVHLYGGPDNDYFFGRDMIIEPDDAGGGGVGYFWGDGGDDVIVFNEEKLTQFYGGSGNDTFTGNPRDGAFNNIARGEDGKDTFTDVVVVIGGAGADKITAHPFGSYIEGGPGKDTITGSSAEDTIQGGLCDGGFWFDGEIDIILGGAANDTFYSGEAFEVLDLAPEDTLVGSCINIDNY